MEWSYFINLEEDKLEIYRSEELLETYDFAGLKESFLEGIKKDIMEE